MTDNISSELIAISESIKSKLIDKDIEYLREDEYGSELYSVLQADVNYAEAKVIINYLGPFLKDWNSGDLYFKQDEKLFYLSVDV